MFLVLKLLDLCTYAVKFSHLCRNYYDYIFYKNYSITCIYFASFKFLTNHTGKLHESQILFPRRRVFNIVSFSRFESKYGELIGIQIVKMRVKIED